MAAGARVVPGAAPYRPKPAPPVQLPGCGSIFCHFEQHALCSLVTKSCECRCYQPVADAATTSGWRNGTRQHFALIDNQATKNESGDRLVVSLHHCQRGRKGEQVGEEVFVPGVDKTKLVDPRHSRRISRRGVVEYNSLGQCSGPPEQGPVAGGRR